MKCYEKVKVFFVFKPAKLQRGFFSKLTNFWKLNLILVVEMRLFHWELHN